MFREKQGHQVTVTDTRTDNWGRTVTRRSTATATENPGRKNVRVVTTRETWNGREVQVGKAKNRGFDTRSTARAARRGLW